MTRRVCGVAGWSWLLFSLVAILLVVIAGLLLLAMKGFKKERDQVSCPPSPPQAPCGSQFWRKGGDGRSLNWRERRRLQ